MEIQKMYYFSELFENRGFDYDWESRTSMSVETLDEHFEAYIALPGIKKKDIKATVDNNLLTIETEQNEKYKINTAYKKTWRLGDSIDTSKIDLKLDAGILIITLPKKEESKSITLTVK